MKARLISNKERGFHGLINDEATYEAVKHGRINWKQKDKITHYIIPASVFERLVKLDRSAVNIPSATNDEVSNNAKR